MRRLQRLVERVATGVSGALMAVIMGILIYNVFARFLGGGISCTWSPPST
jgi:TRAP-type C4-dicarboxylate transport system permease small subunit